MKYLILSCILLITTSFAISQDFYKIKRSVYTIYENGDWVSKRTHYPEDMYAILDNGKIRITNKNESVYIIYGKMDTDYFSEHTTYSTKAIDKRGKDCIIMLKQSPNSTNQLLCIYYFDDFHGFEYLIEK